MAKQPRLAPIRESRMNARQRKLVRIIAEGPRKQFDNSGPFALWMHAPEFGRHAEALGSHIRYNTALSPRLSEFSILVTAQLWRAHYEWAAHELPARRAGVKPPTIDALRIGRTPTSAPRDERAIYDFIREVYRTKRVSERTYKRVRQFLSNEAMVELTGIMGYYAMIAMSLNVFRMLPKGKLPFGAER